MEICGKVLDDPAVGRAAAFTACSNCAGDYEDPDRSAASENAEGEDEPDEELEGFRALNQDSRS